MSSSDRDPLEILMDDFASRWRSGDNPSISDYVGQLPDREDEIRELLPAVALMEKMNQRHSGDASITPAVPRASIPSQLGNYQLLREIGRGGMGIVFEAVQQGLDRRVALKVMNANAITTSQQLKRFQREVRAAASLHHTNIVPVFAVGEEHGTHYYSMQFIDGVALDEYIGALRIQSTLNQGKSTVTGDVARTVNVVAARANDVTESFVATGMEASQVSEGANDAAGESEWSLQEQPTDSAYWKKIAQIGVQVADALGYAHEKGILHRDIKPQNLLMDHSGNVWVTDFGLAKEMHENDATQTGNIVGTLMYMSPEQLHSNATEASDVYSLGLTLYEMLALRPAFGNERRSATLAERMKPQEVARLTTVNPKVPRDLETIVMKAIKYDPADRYPTARALLEDLQNFLEGHAISARRASVIEKSWKWSRRNPLLAISFFSIVVLLSAFSSVTTIGRMRLLELLERSDVLLTQSKTSQRESEVSQSLAEDRLDLATNAFDEILKTYADQSVADTLATEPTPTGTYLDAPITLADIKRLQQLLSFYEKFDGAGIDDPDLNLKIATAKSQIGDIQLRLGRLTQAETSYQEVVQWIDARKLSSWQPELIILRSKMLNELGRVALRQGKMSQALVDHLEARATLLDYADTFGDVPDARFEMARSNSLMLSMLSRRRFQVGTPYRRSSDRRWFEHGRGPREDNQVNWAEGMFQYLTDRQRNAAPVNLSVVPAADFYGELVQELHAATIEFQTLAVEHLDNETFRLAYARSLIRLAHMAGAWDESMAQQAFSKSVEILKAMVDESDDAPLYVYELAYSLSHSRNFHSDHIAVEDLSAAVEWCEQLVRRFSSSYEYNLLLAVTCIELATVYEENDQLPRAEHWLKVAISELEQTVGKVPDQVVLRITLAQTRQQYANVLLNPSRRRGDASRVDGAIEALRLAAQDLRHKEIAQKFSTSHDLTVASVNDDLRYIYTISGQHDKAATVCADASCDEEESRGRRYGRERRGFACESHGP